MNLLLDTHIALWAITDNPKLSAKARRIIAEPRNTIWVSVVNIWEISIKYSLGKKYMPISGKQALAYFRQAGYRVLAIEPEHITAIEGLPPLHQDPFDRLLLAQATTEPIRLITQDAILARYSDNVLLI